MNAACFSSCFCRVALSALLLLLSSAAHPQSDERRFVRLTGYYRVTQRVDSVPAYFIDGMMECYIPLDTLPAGKGNGRPQFADRRFLGERRRKARWVNDDTFVRMSLPALELTSLAESVTGEEYSRRNNGDVYRWGDFAGRWEGNCVTIDELTGREGHELPLDELRVYGWIARLVDFKDTECYIAEPFVMRNLASAQRYQVLTARYRGEDDDERVEVWSEFYVTRRDTIGDTTRRRLLRQKNKDPRLTVPEGIPQPDKDFLQAWCGMEEY